MGEGIFVVEEDDNPNEDDEIGDIDDTEDQFLSLESKMVLGASFSSNPRLSRSLSNRDMDNI